MRDGAGGRRIGSQGGKQGVSGREEGTQTWSKGGSVRGRKRKGRRRSAGMKEGEKLRSEGEGREGVKEEETRKHRLLGQNFIYGRNQKLSIKWQTISINWHQT